MYLYMIPFSVIITSPDKTVSFSIKWVRIVEKPGASETGTSPMPFLGQRLMFYLWLWSFKSIPLRGYL